MDAAPVLADAGLPFRAGLDDIISLVPLYGDIVSGVLQLYQVWLCWLFGVPLNVCIQMVSKRAPGLWRETTARCEDGARGIGL